MKFIQLPLYALIVFLLASSFVNAQTIDFSKAQMAAKKYVRQGKNHALLIGIIQKDKTRVLSYGQMSKYNDSKPDENTLFEIGSVTSVFTTTLAKMEEQNELFKMEDRIQDHFTGNVKVPVFIEQICMDQDPNNAPVTSDEFDRSITVCIPNPMAGSKCISFCDLASHTSGLSNNPKGLYSWNPLLHPKQSKDPYQSFTKEELYNSLGKTGLNYPPGSYVHYSNWGIAVLGNLVADIARKPYEELLSQKILDPLAMTDTWLTVPNEQKNRLAPAHNRRGKATAYWHAESMAPAIGLKSSAKDLLTFVNANLNTNNVALENAFAHVQGPKVDLKPKKSGRFTQMGYGWFTSTLNERTNLPVHWISGGTGGFRTFIGFIKDSQTGVVVLSNSANAVDEIAFLVLEALNQSTKKANESIANKN